MTIIHDPEANPEGDAERFEDWRQEQLAEACYVDMLAHPEPVAMYRDPLTCDECGCFLSKHDSSCSHWAEQTLAAYSALKAAHPESFAKRSRGSRDRKYGGS